MRSSALVCSSPMRGVDFCASSTAASQPAPSSTVGGTISCDGGGAPVAPVCSPVGGAIVSSGSVSPCGAGVGAGFGAGGVLATLLAPSWAGAVPVERSRATGSANNSAALRLVIYPPPATGLARNRPEPIDDSGKSGQSKTLVFYGLSPARQSGFRLFF